MWQLLPTYLLTDLAKGCWYLVFTVSVCVLVTQSCRAFHCSMHCSPPGSSVHGIPQARGWGGLPFPSLAGIRYCEVTEEYTTHIITITRLLHTFSIVACF